MSLFPLLIVLQMNTKLVQHQRETIRFILLTCMKQIPIFSDSLASRVCCGSLLAIADHAPSWPRPREVCKAETADFTFFDCNSGLFARFKMTVIGLQADEPLPWRLSGVLLFLRWHTNGAEASCILWPG